jgi:hypothetical protein
MTAGAGGDGAGQTPAQGGAELGGHRRVEETGLADAAAGPWLRGGGEETGGCRCVEELEGACLSCLLGAEFACTDETDGRRCVEELSGPLPTRGGDGRTSTREEAEEKVELCGGGLCG